jgi:3D (Asp-Asp-Asp) domain-containing protein
LLGYAAQQQALADAQLLVDLLAFAMLLGSMNGGGINAGGGGGGGGGGCGCRSVGRLGGGGWGNTRPVSPWGGSAPWGGVGGPQGPYGAMPGASSSGERLAMTAGQVANRCGTVGWCYRGVKQSIARATGVQLQGGSAWMAADQLARSGRFREVRVSPDQLRSLPPGAVVVWGRTGVSPHGHISVALGNGREASDHVQRQMTSLRGHQNYRVFVPADSPAGGVQYANNGNVPPAQGATFNARGTGYFPENSRMEGGYFDRRGRPLHTLQDYLAGRAPYVSVAMDSNAFRYGTRMRIPELEAKYGRPIEFRVVDTGGAFRGRGTGRIDICTANRAASLDPTVNGRLTLVVQS